MALNDQERARWRPSWPWELEIVAAIFALAAILPPLYVCSRAAPVAPGSLAAAYLALPEQNLVRQAIIYNVYWGIAVLLLYAGHIAITAATRRWISVPVAHMAAPLLFGGIALYRGTTHCGIGTAPPAASCSPPILAAWTVGLLSLVFLTGQVTRWRHVRRFRNEPWLVVSPARWDLSFVRLVPLLRPLLYPPTRYRLSEQGILIEGVNYAMSIPFDVIQAVEYSTLPSLFSSGFFLAGSSRTLVMIRLKDWSEPVFLSPAERDTFVTQAQRVIEARRPPTRCGTRPGTRRGTRPGTRAPAPSSRPEEKNSVAAISLTGRLNPYVLLQGALRR